MKGYIMKKVLCLKRILPVFLFAIIFCSPLYAVTVVIQPGPAEGKDTHVKSISPTINFETYPYFYSEDKTTHIMQALVQLNLPSITAKQINSATLKLYCFDGDANTVNVYANRITSSWSESGATSGCAISWRR